MKLTLVIALLLVVFVQSREKSYKTIFALTWFSGFCGPSKCKAQMIDSWDHQSFSIHGLWTQDYRNNHIHQDSIWFKKHLFKGQLLKQMKNYMPPSTVKRSRPQFLWQHQTQVHSDEYALVQKLLGSKKSQNQLQVQYFEDMIREYLKLNVRKMPHEYWTKRELARHLKLNQNMFSVICRSSYEKDVEEIRICYEIDKKGMRPTKCQRIQSRNCKSPRDRLRLKGWQERGQKDVFSYDSWSDEL